MTPRETKTAFGHEAALAQLQSLATQNRLPHGILISGPQGIGKATLAYQFIRGLLGEDEGTAARITAGSHAGLLVIEPEFDLKKNEYAREIIVDQARKIGGFFALTAAENSWRIVLIDSADALNTQAANAILKVLEEPPERSLLLLISHQPSLLLPTIRSRCQMLRMAPLSTDDFDRVMVHLMPEVDKNERALLAEFTGHAPGLAAEYAECAAAEIYAEIIDIFSHLPAYPAAKIHSFADRLVRERTHANWRIFTRLMLLALSRAAKCAAGLPLTWLVEHEETTLRTLAQLRGADYWGEKWAECAEEFSVAERLHLDYKQVIIAFFHSVNTQEGFHSGMTAA